MRRICLIAVALFLAAGFAFAAQDEMDLDKIVVTPLRYSEEVERVPASVTIITEQDAQNVNATSLPDLLRPVAGIVVRDYYGSATRASVDLRGFGEFAGSNTLVLVDGRRVNEVDLSGVDWTQIPMDAVEKIEIVRGGGSVLYGDNATGGVINIITKKGSGKPTVEAEASGGSYHMNKEKLAISGSKDAVSYSGRASNFSTDGYRQNSEFRSHDYSGKAIYNFSDKTCLDISGSYHNAGFGMPGALRESQLNQYSRRQSLFPDDDVEENDWYLDGGGSYQAMENLSLNLNAAFRRRDVDDNLFSSKSVDKREIDTTSLRGFFELENTIFKQSNKVIGGVDIYNSGASIAALSFYGLNYYQGDRTRQTDIDKTSQGYYLQDELFLMNDLTLMAGYRQENTKYSFNSQPQPGAWTSDLFWNGTVVDSKVTMNENVYNAGLNYIYLNNSKIFLNYSKSFRLPATDEFYSIWATPPVNTGLMAQTSNNYEVGIDHSLADFLNAGITWYDMRINNELYYDPIQFANKNYDRTEHRGIESYVKWSYKNLLTLDANYTFTEAFFKKGAYDGNQIPLIPRNKGLVRGLVNITPNLKLTGAVNMMGKQWLINDQAHNYPRLGGFTTVDMKLMYDNKPKKFLIYAGVNNIFGKKYSEYGAISTMYNERGFYPSPERNYIAGAEVKF